jgi:hypothetical protein
MYAVYLFHGNIDRQNSFLLFLAAILIVLWLPGCRLFYRNIPRDWTLLSYGLYGFILFLLSTIDKDETPLLNLFSPLGIGPIPEERWPSDPQGVTIGGYELSLTCSLPTASGFPATPSTSPAGRSIPGAKSSYKAL